MKLQTKILSSLLAVGLTAALVGGSTMAWFTDQKTVGAATFKAGTVTLNGSTSASVSGINAGNVNPGDTFTYDLKIVYDGTKPAYIRVKKPDISWDKTTTNGIDNILFTSAEINGQSISINQPFTFSDLFSNSTGALGWVYRDGYYYYTDHPILGTEADGSYPAAENESARTLTIKLIGKYDGALTDNSYQGATLNVSEYTIDAIQATNGASTSNNGGWPAVSPASPTT